ncbi:Tat (Twin-arginine translocation) pathway signal sequence domain protein [Rhodopirellula islandica]|uniref:Tat (Twin-arginine translocation) pathway signal sequence domain protein n=2 Tax=Rhodopirellula islandica TaxID=595434 RepID=A0A0J1B8G1_RHOIS|nr:Tat (Twin-arginine translocation) pathway signal sequence domain protein [Rhodopirellula islandica]
MNQVESSIMLSRRNLLQGFAAGAGVAMGAPLLSERLLASPIGNTTPKRVIFFMQNQGFDPKTCIPAGMKHSGSLAKAKLPEPISALEPYKERLHIINGLHGLHTSPSHSAFFGALGGYRGSDGVPPSGSTIDYELSKVLPETLLPHLCIGMDSIENMKTKPTIATLSASGAGQPIFMHSNPNHLYQMLYGGISSGEIRLQHEARSSVLSQIELLAAAKGQSLPASDQQRYGQYVQGFQEVNGLRDRLDTVSDHLREFAPKVDDRYTNPEFETDWHDCLLDLGISALTSGITNTLTIGSGRGEIFGAWKGLGIDQQGHNLGHMDQPDNPIWIKIRQYNSRMLVRIMEKLDSVPEGSGTMMDNTVIVYTSNNADKQHTNGANWPVMLLGNFDGAFKSGCFTQVEGKRPINALYTSLLRAAGQNVDRFNMDDKMAKKFDDSTGPLKEVLA